MSTATERIPMLRPGEIIVDSFAGGGGASQGIARALGRSVDVAINHDADAIAMHAANHPDTRHFTEDVWKVTPRQVTKGRPVGLLWTSPDCKHFSRAKGSKPVDKNIRSLAWVVVRWAVQCPPRIIILENVREFEDWGPLVSCWECAACKWKGTDGQAVLARRKRACPMCESKRLAETADMLPDPKRKGLTFRRFVGRLRGLGYKCEWKVLNAADFGAPTNRRRLFLVARNDGEPINWPEPTHGDPRKIGTGLFDADMKPWRTAAECIDWNLNLPWPSIFERKKPLAEKTLRRIALGIKRYVLDNPRPFIVGVGGRAGQSPPTAADSPLGTVTAKNDRAVVSPIIIPVIIPVTHHGERRACDPKEPLPTVTGANRGEFAAIAPTLINVAYGDKGRYGDGTADLHKPIGTVHAGGNNFAIVAPVLYPRNGEFPGQTPRCQTVEKPLNTVTTDGNSGQLATAILVGAGGVVGVPVDTPLPANLIHLNHGDKQWSAVDEPGRTATTGRHAALVYSFMTKYFGTAVGVEVDAPMPTVTGKDRFGLIMVHIDGEPYVVVDIGMRMLRPRELARAQGFNPDYILTGTNTSQVARIGNSVPPDLAEAIVRANCAVECAMAG